MRVSSRPALGPAEAPLASSSLHFSSRESRAATLLRQIRTPGAAMPLELRLAEATLRVMANQRIANGELPWIPLTSWINVACGRGAKCCLCGTSIRQHQLEYKITDGYSRGCTSLHALCHAVWRECAERMLTGADGGDR